MFKNAKVIGSIVNPDVYHNQQAARGAAEFFMSPSSLKQFGQCPERWKLGYNPPESDAKSYGSLLDCLVLTPELFESRYVLQPETYTNEKMEVKKWNNNATKCKEWNERQVGKKVLSQHELQQATTAKNRLMADEVIASFINASDKQVLVEGEWHDEETGLVAKVRCLMDLVPRKDTEFYKSLGDLKSTRTAALIPFQRDVYKMGYHVQGAFDLDLFTTATGEDRCNWVFCIQESYPPWQTGKRLLSEDYLEIGRAEYKRLLRLYCKCVKTGFWPGYDDNEIACQGWTLVSPEAWMASEDAFSFKYEFPESYERSTETPDADLIP